MSDYTNELTTIIDESKHPQKLIAAPWEAIEMIKQGKSNEEILSYFGI